MADIQSESLQEYPMLRSLPLAFYQSQATPGDDRMLEFWPPGETGDAGNWRPNQIPEDKIGIQILSPKTRPIDVLADVTSHYLVNTDPKIKAYYDDFVSSLTQGQKDRLADQYKWAVVHEREKRPFVVWEKASGLPAYFRGYAFQQWPSDFNERAYTPSQRKMFDDMMKYLTAPDRAKINSSNGVRR